MCFAGRRPAKHNYNDFMILKRKSFCVYDSGVL